MSDDRFDERRRDMDREAARFTRMWRWLFLFCIVLGVAGSIVTIALLAGAAAWLWSLVP